MNKVLVFCKAPVAGAVKTRLIPALGAQRAAALQQLLIRHALELAVQARVGDVELWGAPAAEHPLLLDCVGDLPVEGVSQCEGDLGARMLHAAITTLAGGARPIIIGSDCPALDAAHLSAASRALDEDCDAAFVPAEDGGYVLAAFRAWHPSLFEQMPWSMADVMEESRSRMRALGWRWHECAPLWDVDRPDDYTRLLASGLIPECEQRIGRR